MAALLPTANERWSAPVRTTLNSCATGVSHHFFARQSPRMSIVRTVPFLLSPRQCIQIDISAGKNDANASTGEGDFPFQSGREGNGRGRFDDDLHRLPDRAHRFNNGFLTYRSHVVEVALDDFEVWRAHTGAQTVGHR